MRTIIRSVLLLAAGIAVGWIAFGNRRTEPASPETTATSSAPTRQKTLWTCGMHPEIISDEPGTCPKCQMKLTPMDPDRAQMILEARGDASGSSGAAPRGPSSGGPTITIDPVTQQNMGLRFAIVRTGALAKRVRTVGNITYDESGLGVVSAKSEGWIEKVHVDQAGAQVHRGDPLFEFYSPQLVSAQQEYLVAVRDGQQSGDGTAATMARKRLDAARDRLRYFDLDDAQIDALEKRGAVTKTVTIPAQLTGVVTERMATQGSRVMPNEPLYKIADISTVWVVGKVFESDLPFIKLGQEAFMRLDYLPGRSYRGRVTQVYPYLEPGTREVPVRMEFHNPGYDLKPGMYATIEIESQLGPDTLLIPRMAVLDTGTRQVAFVQRAPGKFEARNLTLGSRNDADEMQVLSGIAEGETVVVSGQFLLDSESRLREAALKMLAPAATGGGANEMLAVANGTGPAPTGSVNQSRTDTIVDKVAKFVCPMPEHAGVLYDTAGDCPLCGMKLVPARSGSTTTPLIDHYTCPMPEHQYIHADKPGKCPECGMTLIPVTQQTTATTATTQLYTCPMEEHAHIVHDAPGDCEDCGMELVPTGTVKHGAQSEAAWAVAHGNHTTTGTLQTTATQTSVTTSTGATQASLPLPTLYTCPMEEHAQVVKDHPGDCELCGMKLVPTSTVKHREQSEAAWRAQQAAARNTMATPAVTPAATPATTHQH